ncbi:MAG: hypothetical protein QM759_03675 [Terricaulis sp.]
MRALIACLVLVGCATDADPRTPAERVAGCWINRDAGAVIMRWLPDPGHPGALNGTRSSLGIGGRRTEHFALEQDPEGWRMCRQGEAPQCWSVAQGDGGSLQGGRVFIDAAGDNLHIAVMGDGPEHVIFQGRRDGCD